jgi:hypothetical protein
VLSRFRAIADSAKALVKTDLPQRGLPDLVKLALAAKSTKITSVQFVPPLIHSSDPDFTVIQDRVRAAIRSTDKAKAPVVAGRGKSAARTRPQASVGPASGDAAVPADLATVCGH